MMTDEEILALLKDERFCNYCLKENDDDVRYWERWIKEHEEDKHRIESQRLLVILLASEITSRQINQQYESLKQISLNQGQVETAVVKRLRNLVVKISVAASLLLAAGIAIYAYYADRNSRQASENIVGIHPGSDKAFLILSNGSRIDLTNAPKGKLINESGSDVINTGGEIAYSLAPSPDLFNQSVFNTLEIPKGGQFKVILSDGTSVYLNAASSLKYPASFTNVSERIVELIGQAYFEVRHDAKKPFIVKTKGQIIKDIGTAFETSSYPDDLLTKTTLISGSVSVSANIPSVRKPASVTLRPGQQAGIGRSGELVVATADTSVAVAWKNGNFYFKNADIRSVMREISRWYNVSVTYSGPITSDGFTGRISKSLILSDVLDRLEASGFVRFKTRGRRVQVIGESKLQQ